MDYFKNMDFRELLAKLRELFSKMDRGDVRSKVKPAFNKLLDFLKKAPGILAAITVFLTVLADPAAGSTESASLVNEEVRALVDASFMSKGLTNDGKYYYTSGTASFAKYTALAKYEIGTMKRETYRVFPLTWDMIREGYDNIGGISYYDGKLYAAMESGNENALPRIAVFDADSLAYETSYELPQSWFPQGIKWAAVDPASGILYTCAWPSAESIHAFRIADAMTHLGEINVTGAALDRICGGEVYDGVLYLSQDVEYGRINNVLRVDLEAGEAEVAFTRDSGRSDNIAGDLTVHDKRDDGSLFHVSDYNGLIGVYLRSYAVL